MSPEQARGLRNIDHRSDLWSLGVIAHKCVTGVLPFEGESVGDLLVKICTSPLADAVGDRARACRASFDAWFMRALEREPARRFASALRARRRARVRRGAQHPTGARSSPGRGADADDPRRARRGAPRDHATRRGGTPLPPRA